MDDGHALTEEVCEHPVGCGLPGRPSFDGVMKFIAVFFPITGLGHPGQAGVEGGFDKAVLPVFECGFEGILEFIISQLVDTVAAGAEELGGISDNHDWRLSRTAAMTFFSMGEWLSARARSTMANALSWVRESNQD